MLDEGVVAAPQDIDLAMITGAGFSFWNGGLTFCSTSRASRRRRPASASTDPSRRILTPRARRVGASCGRMRRLDAVRRQDAPTRRQALGSGSGVGRTRVLVVVPAAEPAVGAAVGEVDDEPDRHPDQEAEPGLGDQVEHQVAAQQHRRGGDDVDPRHPERAVQVGARPAQDQHAHADEHEGEQRADADQVAQRLERHEARQHRDHDRGHRGDAVRRAERRVDLGQADGQQPVAGHREGDPRLAHHQDQHDDGQPDGGPDGDQVRYPVQPDVLERRREGCRVVGVDVAVGLHAGDDEADRDVEDGHDGERRRGPRSGRHAAGSWSPRRWSPRRRTR